jgi:transcriptional regulator with XRE-family HTH domain
MPRTGTDRSVVEIHGFALRVIREARGRKTAELAEALGVDRSYIAKIETGHSRRVGSVFYSRLLRELVIEDYRALLAAPHIVEVNERIPA